MREIARDLELTREDVLGWLKKNASRQAELAKQYPPEPERVAVVKTRRKMRDDDGFRESHPDDRFDDNSNNGRQRDEYDSQTSYLRNAPHAREGPHVPRGMPAYKAGDGLIYSFTRF